MTGYSLGGVVLHTAAKYPDLAGRLVVAPATIRHGVMVTDAHSRGARLLAGASRAELDPGHDANGGQQQPRRKQDVRSEAEDGQGHDGNEDDSDDRQHGYRSPFMSQGDADVSRLPPPAARVDPDQPWFTPEVHPESISVDPTLWLPRAGRRYGPGAVCRGVARPGMAASRADPSRRERRTARELRPTPVTDSHVSQRPRGLPNTHGRSAASWRCKTRPE